MDLPQAADALSETQNIYLASDKPEIKATVQAIYGGIAYHTQINARQRVCRVAEE